MFANSLMSVAILCAVAPKDASGARTSISIFREYVCEVTGYAYSNPDNFVTNLSSSSTYYICISVDLNYVKRMKEIGTEDR